MAWYSFIAGNPKNAEGLNKSSSVAMDPSGPATISLIKPCLFHSITPRALINEIPARNPLYSLVTNPKSRPIPLPPTPNRNRYFPEP